MSENLEELLSRYFQENTRQILDTTREMIRESREQTLDETRGMIQESREGILSETRGMVQETREDLRGMIQESEHRMTILLEDIRGDVRAIAEGLEMTRQRFELVRSEDRQDIDDLDRRVTRLEVRVASS